MIDLKRIPRPISEGILKMIQSKTIVEELRRFSSVPPYARSSQPMKLKDLARCIFASRRPVNAVKGLNRRH